MAILYHVYLSKLATTPDNWDTANEADYDHANGWVMFIASSISDSFRVMNTHKHLQSHTSYRLTTGKVVQTILIGDCIMANTGDTEDSDYYNAVKQFLLRHALTGTSTEAGYDLYLRIYNPSGGSKYVKFVDDTETWRDYCQVAVKSFNFVLTHDGIYRGSIQLEEVWT